MELGNLLMGHSRDAVPVSDCRTYREVMQNTWAKIRANSTYQPAVSHHIMLFDPLALQLASLERAVPLLLLEYRPTQINEDSK